MVLQGNLPLRRQPKLGRGVFGEFAARDQFEPFRRRFSVLEHLDVHHFYAVDPVFDMAAVGNQADGVPLQR